MSKKFVLTTKHYLPEKTEENLRDAIHDYLSKSLKKRVVHQVTLGDLTINAIKAFAATDFSDNLVKVTQDLAAAGLRVWAENVAKICITQTKGKIKSYAAIQCDIDDKHFICSVNKLLQGKYNEKRYYPDLIEAILTQIDAVDVHGHRSEDAKACRTEINKTISVFPHYIRRNAFNKKIDRTTGELTKISMKVINDLRPILKTTPTEWLLLGQLSEKGMGTPENLEEVMQECPTLDVVEALYGYKYIDERGEFTSKFDELPWEKQKIIVTMMNQPWFIEKWSTDDLAFWSQIKADFFNIPRQSIQDQRDIINHFRGDDIERVNNPLSETENSMKRTLTDSKNYGYNLDNLGYPISRLFEALAMVSNNAVYKKYSIKEILDHLYISNRILILNEILHVEMIKDKLEPIKNLHGNAFFEGIYHVLRSSDGLSNDMIQIRKALETHVLPILNQRDKIYSTHIYKDKGIEYKTVLTYGRILDKIDETAHAYILSAQCCDSINKALASCGMYGAGKKALTPFYDEEDKTFYDLDWTVKTKKSVLDQMSIEFEAWCDQYYESLGKNKHREREREALEMKSDAETNIILSLEGIHYKGDDDDYVGENDPNATWDLNYDINIGF